MAAARDHPPSLSPSLSPSPSSRRQSAFVETGLEDTSALSPTPSVTRPACTVRFNSIPEIFEIPSYDTNEPAEAPQTTPTPSLDHQYAAEKKRLANRPSLSANSTLAYRLSAACVILAIFIPLLHGYPWVGHTSFPILGVRGGPVPRDASILIGTDASLLPRQADSPTEVCSRWAHMTALVNGTLFIYGGEASTEYNQKSNTWNNDFLTLDLTKSWQTGEAPIVGLPQPSGPPNVSLGSLWHSYTSLYLYGGEYSSDPPVQPQPYSLWEYDIAGAKWNEHSDPTTSAGASSSGAGQAVGQAAEGAGIAVPLMGRAWYFGGHQDAFTTAGWSVQVARVYLTSLLEYTFPGQTNDQVNSLTNGKTAGSDGVWRNVTDGPGQDGPGFSERADGLLLYIPGYGAEGILVGLAGGTNQSFQQMSQIDVYDIATSSWYKQATDGPTPKMRVNPCAVVAAAPDGSSQNIYMWGGQNLQPADNQTQYDDMWILTLPAFTWIQVDQTNQSVPLARAGHTCNIWNGQMVVVGGYIGASDATCDSPGVYVYDLSNLAWRTSYNDLSATSPDASIAQNPLNQQMNQRSSNAGSNSGPGGLEGSYGYSVPPAVASVIGGGPQGGATITQPAQLPTDGPMKTGRPVTYTVTATATATGAAVTETAAPAPVSHRPDTGAIVAGVLAGVLAVAALYLAYCAWLYRQRMKTYKRHVAMANRMSYEAGEDMAITGGAAGWYAGHAHKDSGSDSGKGNDEGSAFITGSGSGEGRHSHGGSGSGSGGNSQISGRPGPGRQGSAEDLLSGGEPSFWGTMLSPRRSLRVTNRD